MIHYGIKKEYHKAILNQVDRVGLARVNYSKTYLLRKTGSKTSSSDDMAFDIIVGHVKIIGDNDCVALFIENSVAWYKTSPVLSCTKIKGGFIIETKNSYYRILG